MRRVFSVLLLMVLASGAKAQTNESASPLRLHITSPNGDSANVRFYVRGAGAELRGIVGAIVSTGSGENRIIEVTTPATLNMTSRGGFNLELVTLDESQSLMVQLSGARWERPRTVFASGARVALRRQNGEAEVRIMSAEAIWGGK